MATEQLQLEEKKAFPLGMALEREPSVNERGKGGRECVSVCVCEKDCEQEGGRENERRGDVCEAEIAREGKGACLSACVCVCVCVLATDCKEAS